MYLTNYLNQVNKVIQVITLLIFFYSGGLLMAAPATGKVVIINSDTNINKYQQAEAAFKQELQKNPVQIINLNLDSNANSENLLKQINEINPDLIYSIGSKAYQLVDQANTGKPLLFSSVINWQRFNLNPNTHGVANELSLAQELSLLGYLLPNARRIGVIYDPRYSQQRINEARDYAKQLGITLEEAKIDGTSTAIDLLDNLLPKIDLLWLIADPGVLTDKATIEAIYKQTEQMHKPIYTYSEAFISYGASLIVAADTPTIGRQAATMAEAILRHEPITSNVQAAAGSHIILNTCQMHKIKADYNADALESVNQIIDCH